MRANFELFKRYVLLTPGVEKKVTPEEFWKGRLIQTLLDHDDSKNLFHRILLLHRRRCDCTLPFTVLLLSYLLVTNYNFQNLRCSQAIPIRVIKMDN